MLINGHILGQILGDSEGQGGLAACCSPRGHKEPDMTEWLNNNCEKHLNIISFNCKNHMRLYAYSSHFTDEKTEEHRVCPCGEGAMQDTCLSYELQNTYLNQELGWYAGWGEELWSCWEMDWCVSFLHQDLPGPHMHAYRGCPWLAVCEGDSGPNPAVWAGVFIERTSPPHLGGCASYTL